MAWPRMKNSRSSAEPGIHPHDGVQATVTPAPDAEPPSDSGQNTGVNGTRHAVAQNPAASRSGPGGPRTGRLPRPIRYAHAEPAERDGEPEPVTGPVLSGIVLPPATPAPPRPAEGARSPEGAGPGERGRPGESPRPSGEEPADRGKHGKIPADEGLGIFNGLATTEVTDDPPARDAGRGPRFPPRRGAAPAAPPESQRVAAVGAEWNQPITPPPVPSELGGGG